MDKVESKNSGSSSANNPYDLMVSSLIYILQYMILNCSYLILFILCHFESLGIIIYYKDLPPQSTHTVTSTLLCNLQ